VISRRSLPVHHGAADNHVFGAVGVTGLNLWSMIVAIAGSIVVLLIYNALTGRRHRA
jgi:uncharacterized membrane protein YeaQ/YmgE (transglycosylase-associated protein family)